MHGETGGRPRAGLEPGVEEGVADVIGVLVQVARARQLVLREIDHRFLVDDPALVLALVVVVG